MEVESVMKVEVAAGEKSVTVEVPPAGNIPSFFVFSLHKAGSVLQDKVTEDICRELSIPTISVPKAAFAQGVPDASVTKEGFEQVFKPNGYGFYGFRYLPTYIDDIDLSKFKKLLLIRDPRDMLVSHYFSMKKSHPIPEGDVGEKLTAQREKLQSVDVDSYVLEKAPKFLGAFQRYQAIDDENFALFRYEDIVFEKEQWVRDIAAFLDVSLSDSKIKEIAKKHDIFPDKEDASSHIRKVSPGDHKEKLKSETIEQLNVILQPILERYRYS